MKQLKNIIIELACKILITIITLSLFVSIKLNFKKNEVIKKQEITIYQLNRTNESIIENNKGLWREMQVMQSELNKK